MKWFLDLNIATKFILFFVVGMGFFLNLAAWSQYGFAEMERIDQSIATLAILRKDSMASALIAVRYAAAAENSIRDTATANHDRLNQLLANMEKSINKLSVDNEAIKKTSGNIVGQIRNILNIPANPDEGLIEESELLGDIAVEYNESLTAIEKDLGLSKQAFLKKYNLWTIVMLVISVVMAGLMVLIIRISVTRPLERLRIFSDNIASGNLTDELEVESKGEIGQLARALSGMEKSLQNIVGEVLIASDDIKDASSAISVDNNHLSELTESQAIMLSQTVANVNHISASIKQNAEYAQKADQLASDAEEVARKGALAITMTIASTEEIDSGNKEISDITAVIDGIAFQTNLLALNAAVEAARAGHEGRGFAVVANEVRSLAQRSAESAKDIRRLIEESVRRAESFSQQVDQSGQALSEIIGAVKEVAKVVAEMAEATNSTLINIDQINGAVGSMDNMTRENKNIVQNAVNYSVRLKDRADHLNELVSFFQVAGTAASPEKVVTLESPDSDGSTDISDLADRRIGNIDK